jgi:hypothetical protein
MVSPTFPSPVAKQSEKVADLARDRTENRHPLFLIARPPILRTGEGGRSATNCRYELAYATTLPAKRSPPTIRPERSIARATIWGGLVAYHAMPGDDPGPLLIL